MAQLQYEMFPDETEGELETGHLDFRGQSGKITERELVVIKMRYGVDMPNEQALTLAQIGKIYNLTKQRVEQIEARAMRKLRNNPEMLKLRHLVIGDVT